MRFACIILVGAAGLIAGCQDNDQAAREWNIRQRQDAALKDPFNYSPGIDTNAVGGGGTMEFDRNAFRRDVRNVFDP